MAENGCLPKDVETLRSMIRGIVLEELGAASNTKDEDKCAYCEGTFPERALNYQNGDPACVRCWDALPEER